MKYFLLSFLFVIHSAFAQNCETMNLVTEENSPFNKIPVYDQDGIGICYAYVAAQLVDYHLVKKGSERSVHPLWAALKYAEKAKQERITAGITYDTIQQMIKTGNCKYDSVSSAIGQWAVKANVKEVDIMDLVERLAPKFKNLYDSKKNGTTPPSLSEEEVDKAINEAIADHQPWCTPGATWDALMPELRALSALSSRKVLTDLILPVCGQNLQKLNIPPAKYFHSDVDAEWSKTLDKKLQTLKAPVSISYCSEVLGNPTFDGVERRTQAKGETYHAECGGHESLIVGKKKIGETCHYLLRNSWGNGFSSSTENWNCLCKHRTTGQLVDDCKNSTHNNGEYTVEGCWINGDQLAKNSFGMTSLENPPPQKSGAKKK